MESKKSKRKQCPNCEDLRVKDNKSRLYRLASWILAFSFAYFFGLPLVTRILEFTLTPSSRDVAFIMLLGIVSIWGAVDMSKKMYQCRGCGFAWDKNEEQELNTLRQ